MSDYSQWLSSQDPQSPITDLVTLKSDKRIDSGVDIEMNITSQYMIGHSQGVNETFTAISDYKANFFQIARDVTAKPNDVFSIEGEYSVAGTLEESDNAVVSGKGKFILQFNKTFQYLAHPYTLTENGYIDISGESPYESVYFLNWTHIEFNGLQVSRTSGNDSGLKQDLTLVSRVLALVYKRFLTNWLEFSDDIRPPAKLLKNYLTDVLSVFIQHKKLNAAD